MVGSTQIRAAEYNVQWRKIRAANILFTPAFYGNALSTLTRTHTLYFVPCWCGFMVVDSPNHCTLYFVGVECGCGLFLGVRRLVHFCTMAMLRRLFLPAPTAAMAGDQKAQPAMGTDRHGRTDRVDPS